MNYQVVDVHLQGHQNYYHLWYLGSAYLDQNSPFSFHEIHLFCFMKPQKNGHYHFPLNHKCFSLQTVYHCHQWSWIPLHIPNKYQTLNATMV